MAITAPVVPTPETVALTKREYFACFILSGLVAANERSLNQSDLVDVAYNLASAMITKLESNP